VAALDANLGEARCPVCGEARRVGREDAARELVEAVALGLVGQRVEEAAAEALSAGLATDVDTVLADAAVDAAIRVGAHPREADHAPIVALGDEERQARLEPGEDLRRLARAGLEGGLALGDPDVVERGDRLGVGRLSGADGGQGLRARMIADPAAAWTRWVAREVKA
jgi:hypothetical protein